VTTKAIRHLAVSTPQGNSGVLARENGYFFQYSPDIAPESEIALNMQRRMEPYRSQTLLPIFEMNLPEGYFICMGIVREAGVPVPDFYLSENRRLFVMRRFDRTSAGEPIGFEDMASLMGRSAQEKYTGSYTQVARAIEAYCAPEHVSQAKAQLFDQVVLSVMLGNGDAHLKNFGLLYTHPLAGDVRMAPAYDIVNTTRYIPEDQLALTLNGSKSLFRARAEILPFAKVCGISDPVERLGQLIRAAETIMFTQQELLDDETELRDAIRQGIDLFTDTYERA